MTSYITKHFEVEKKERRRRKRASSESRGMLSKILRYGHVFRLGEV